MTLKEFYKSGQIGYICGANLNLILEQYNSDTEVNICPNLEICIDNDGIYSKDNPNNWVVGVELDIENDIAVNINVDIDINKVKNIIYSKLGEMIFKIDF